MLCGLLLVQQAAIGNGLSFDPFPFDENGLASAEVDVSGRQVADALIRDSPDDSQTNANIRAFPALLQD